MSLSKKERKNWLKGRKVHGVKNNFIACKQDFSLAYGWASYEGNDMRQITCKTCRKILKKT
jgi:hypothetical protein